MQRAACESHTRSSSSSRPDVTTASESRSQSVHGRTLLHLPDTSLVSALASPERSNPADLRRLSGKSVEDRRSSAAGRPAVCDYNKCKVVAEPLRVRSGRNVSESMWGKMKDSDVVSCFWSAWCCFCIAVLLDVAASHSLSLKEVTEVSNSVSN